MKKSKKRITVAAVSGLLAVSLILPALAAEAPAPIRVGSWKGRTLEEGVTSLLVLSEDGKTCTAASSDPAVLTVRQVFGRWCLTTQGPGEATVTVTAPDGRTGSMTVTVKPDEPAAPAGEPTQEPEAQPQPEPKPEPRIDPYAELNLEVVRLVNEARKENGVGELTVNDELMNAAQICSERERSWHESKEDCETALACGYPHGFGSNITAFTSVGNEYTARHAVTNWLNSSGHRDTMLDASYETIGVGITKTERGTTYCYLFVGNPNSHNPYGTD